VGVAAVLGFIFLVIAAIFGAWGPFFVVLIAGGLVILSPILFGARRAAGVDPENPSHEEVSDPSAPTDASPRSPHGYTPST
jgi:hypothetical protein